MIQLKFRQNKTLLLLDSDNVSNSKSRRVQLKRKELPIFYINKKAKMKLVILEISLEYQELRRDK
jgi:hypothetical protein